MSTPNECVIDTMILQKANALIETEPREASLFARRLNLLEAIHRGGWKPLVSKMLIHEYERKLPAPRNDFIRAFLELIGSPGRAEWNYALWPASQREKARKCRFPGEDTHVLRTAIRPHRTFVFTEEIRMLRADPCVYREFRVHIYAPPESRR